MGVVVSVVSIAVTSSVLGILYERTANLTVPVVSHAPFDVVLITLSLAMAL